MFGTLKQKVRLTPRFHASRPEPRNPVRVDPHDGDYGYCPECSCPDCDYPLGTGHSPECSMPTLAGV